MVRQLNVPVGFGVDLQSGPMPRQKCPRALLGPEAEEEDCIMDDERTMDELGRDYQGLVTAIKQEMCVVEGLVGLQADARKGRSGGLSTVGNQQWEMTQQEQRRPHRHQGPGGRRRSG